MDPIDKLSLAFLVVLLISCGMSANTREINGLEKGSRGDSNVSKPEPSELLNNALPIHFEIYKATSDSTIALTDDEFVLEALERVLDYNSVKSNCRLLKIATIQNKFDENQTDTIISLIRSGKDKYVYYISHINKTLLEAEITTPDIVFGKNIHVGISRIELLGMFNVEAPVDTLVVSDLERYSEFTFIFKRDTLRSISFISRYLD